MRLPSTDDDAQNIEVDDNLCNEANCPALSMMAAILDSKGIDVSEYEVEVEKDVEDVDLENSCVHEYRNEDYFYVDESLDTIPVMLGNLTYDSRDNSGTMLNVKVKETINVKKAYTKRKELRKRTKHFRAKADATSNLMALMAKKYDTRFQKRVEVERELSQPQSDEEDQSEENHSKLEEEDVEISPPKYLAQVDELEPRRSNRIRKMVDYEELNKNYEEPLSGDEDGVTESKGENNSERQYRNVTVRSSRHRVRPKRMIDYEEELINRTKRWSEKLSLY